jgi:hypothetical protein
VRGRHEPVGFGSRHEFQRQGVERATPRNKTVDSATTFEPDKPLCITRNAEVLHLQELGNNRKLEQSESFSAIFYEGDAGVERPDAQPLVRPYQLFRSRCTETRFRF